MPNPSNSTIVWYLEICDPKAVCGKTGPPGFDVFRIAPSQLELNRQMYQAVGEPWDWTDRLAWSDDEWYRYVHRECLETWVGRLHGQSIGYFELERQHDGNVEIAYFGLLPERIGQGLGGPLLTAAIECAWQIPKTRRVWVHTCSRDHQHALDNYRNRGFNVYKMERV